MAEWTVDPVAERFAESAETARRLRPVRVQGCFNLGRLSGASRGRHGAHLTSSPGPCYSRPPPSSGS